MSEMRFFQARWLMLCGVMATFLSLAQAQTAATPPATSATSADERLQSAEETFRAGSAAYQQNDLPSAHVQFEKLVLMVPEVAAAHSAFGTVLLAEGDAPSALVQLELAHRLDPQDAGAILNLAMTYEQLRDYAKSVQMFQLLDQTGNGPSQKLTPQASITYAIAFSAVAEPEAAQKQLEKALIDSPDNAALYDTLGTVLAQQEHYAQASVQIQRAISLDPTLASAHFHLGSVYLNQGNASAAVRELNKATDLAKDNVEYTLQYARALRADNQDDSALAVLQHALSLDPISIDAKYELALTLQAKDNAREALPLFEQVVTARPQDFSALTNLGLALVQTGDAKRAIPIYIRALTINGLSPAK